MMDDLGLIHMNGRIYDPLTGRFLSADQVIQSPLNLQSYNRYSYCMNNPTGYVDPSGYYAAAAAIPLIEASAYVVTAATAVYLSSPYLQKAVQTMGESMVSLKDAVVDMFKEPGFSDEKMSALQGLESEGCQVIILTSGSVLVVFPNTTELDGNKTQTGNIELQSQTPATVQDKPQEVHPTIERTEGEIATSQNASGEATTPPPESGGDNDDDEPEYQTRTRDNESGDYRPKTTGANKKDGKMLDDAAKKAGVDRNDLREAVHKYKFDNRMAPSQNLTYEKLVEIAEGLK
ncbi:MAG: RHS repeat-associated core domain-containing protein [Opitutales bacterium]|nr:RHS repeat-associated core domain-containing protein [Opitutales bacterium]